MIVIIYNFYNKWKTKIQHTYTLLKITSTWIFRRPLTSPPRCILPCSWETQYLFVCLSERSHATVFVFLTSQKSQLFCNYWRSIRSTPHPSPTEYQLVFISRLVVPNSDMIIFSGSTEQKREILALIPEWCCRESRLWFRVLDKHLAR